MPGREDKFNTPFLLVSSLAFLAASLADEASTTLSHIFLISAGFSSKKSWSFLLTKNFSATCGKIKEYEIGRPNHYNLVHIPPMLWYGFQSLDGQTALVANCADYPHNPDDNKSLPYDSDQIPYQWKP